MQSARIAKLEELLARVRANAALGPPQRGEVARSAPIPAPAEVAVEVEDDVAEIDRSALRLSLERHVELALGDETPAVPFAEETDGWEPAPLELERDDGPRFLRSRLPDVPLVTAFQTDPAPPPSMPPPRPTPASMSHEETAREPVSEHEDVEPLYPAGSSDTDDAPPSVLGEVLALAARRADGEIDPRAIWDGVAGQLKGRRSSSGVLAAVKSPGASPSGGGEKPAHAGEAAIAAPPSSARGAAEGRVTQAAPLDVPDAPASKPRSARPALALDHESDLSPELDFDDEPSAPSAAPS
ncbi:MAG TPA: hypothetical protein VL400_11685, partial [Polyangiaceae bacterium]|nr:hypothetical protein [Polyangiaceae bacterium]